MVMSKCALISLLKWRLRVRETAHDRSTYGCRKEVALDAIGNWVGSSLEFGPVVKSSSLGSSGWSSQYTLHTKSGEKVFAKVAMGEDVVMFKGEALGLQAMYGEVVLPK